MAQLMPLPLTVSCFTKMQIGFTFLVPAHLSSPEKCAVKRVCVYAYRVGGVAAAAVAARRWHQGDAGTVQWTGSGVGSS